MAAAGHRAQGFESGTGVVTEAKSSMRIRLARVPDRTQVKLSIAVAPSLHADLLAYAKLYEQVHGRAEVLGVLVPHMLANFLASDRDFARWRKRNGGTSEEGL